jgi:glycosyltransferase involved in cell wall biosynthesis
MILNDKHRGSLISIAMIVRNEEEFLPQCLESVADFRPEIVIFDTGSTDRTVEIANSFGAKVFEVEWTGDFAFHRNQALDKCTGDFVFYLDADEVVINTDVAQTLERLAGGGVPDLILVRETLAYPNGREVTVLAPRIFRRSAGFRFVHPVHERLDAENCDAVLSNVRIFHHGYLRQEDLEAKERRNLAIAMAMEDGPHAFHCRMRACFSLPDYDGVLEAATGLVSLRASPALTVEGCIHGAAAAYNLQRDDELDSFLEVARQVAPDSPDLHFMELLRAGRKYLRSLASGDSMAPGDFLRPWVFWHDVRQVHVLMETLVGKRSNVDKPSPALKDERS